MAEQSRDSRYSRLVDEEAEEVVSTRADDDDAETTDDNENENKVKPSTVPIAPSSTQSTIAQAKPWASIETTRTTSLIDSTTALEHSSLLDPAFCNPVTNITTAPISTVSPKIQPGNNTEQDEKEPHRFLENAAEPTEPSVLGEEPYPVSRVRGFFASLKTPLRRDEQIAGGGEPRAIRPLFKKNHRPSTRLIKTAPLNATQKPKIRALVAAKFGSMFYIGLVSVLVLLALHIALVGLTDWSSPYGITIITSKSACRDLRTPKYLLILVVNIFAAVVGLVADKTLRCVLSPNRQDLDAAHELGEYMTIGVISFRNWKRVGWPNKIITVFLIFSSLPLSLFYNALLFQITPAHSSYQVLLSESFFKATAFNLAATNVTTAMSILLPPSTSLASWPTSWPGVSLLDMSLQNLQQSGINPVGWMETPFDQCEKTYIKPYRENVGNVVLTTKWSLTNETILGIGYLDFHSTDLNTLCPAAFYEATANSSGVSAGQRKNGLGFQQISGGPKWAICPAKDDKNQYYKPDPSTIPTVSTCYHEPPKAGICRLGFNNTFLLVITACLVVKTLCHSILEKPRIEPQPAKDRCPSAVEHFSISREWGWLWYTIVFVYIFVWTILMVLSAFGAKDVANNRSARWWYIRLAILANSVQLVLAIRTYVERSWIFAHTISNEWEDLRRTRQGLRVSFPSGGAQRRTLLMGYPMKKAIIYNGFNVAIGYFIAAMVSGEMGNVILPGDDTGGRDFNLVYGINFGEISISKAPFLLMAFLPSILIYVTIIMVRLVVDKDEISHRSKLLDKGYTIYKFTVHGKKSSTTHRQLQREDEDWMPKPGFNSFVIATACQPSVSNNRRQGDYHGDMSKSRLKWGVIEEPNPKPQGRILDSNGGSISARQYWAKRQEALFRGPNRRSDGWMFASDDEPYRWESEILSQDIAEEMTHSHESGRESEGNHTPQQAGHCGLSSDRVGAVRPMALYTGLGRGVDPRWKRYWRDEQHSDQV